MSGDHLNREDYVELYGDHWVVRSSVRTRLLIAILILGWIGALLLVSGCDGQAAANTAQAEQEAYDKKVALLGMPCLYVAQCIHEPCSTLHRRCVKSADLTERK